MWMGRRKRVYLGKIHDILKVEISVFERLPQSMFWKRGDSFETYEKENLKQGTG